MVFAVILIIWFGATSIAWVLFDPIIAGGVWFLLFVAVLFGEFDGFFWFLESIFDRFRK